MSRPFSAILALFCLFMGVLCGFLSLMPKDLLDSVWSIPRLSARELQSMPADKLNGRMVRVEGTIRCDRPAIPPAAGIPTPWYRHVTSFERRKLIHRKYELPTEWVIASDMFGMAWFEVRDGADSVLVKPGNTDVYCSDRVYHRVTSHAKPPAHGDRWTGDRKDEEWIFPPSGHVVAIGAARRVDGKTIIGPSDDDSDWVPPSADRAPITSGYSYDACSAKTSKCPVIGRSMSAIVGYETWCFRAWIAGTVAFGAGFITCILTLIHVRPFVRLIRTEWE